MENNTSSNYTIYENILDAVILHSQCSFMTPHGQLSGKEVLEKVWWKYTPEKKRKPNAKNNTLQRDAWSKYKARVCNKTGVVEIKSGKEWLDFDLKIVF